MNQLNPEKSVSPMAGWAAFIDMTLWMIESQLKTTYSGVPTGFCTRAALQWVLQDSCQLLCVVIIHQEGGSKSKVLAFLDAPGVSDLWSLYSCLAEASDPRTCSTGQD